MILVFGKTGQVARELQLLDEVIALGREEVDLCHPDVCAQAIHQYTPIGVINAAAYTAVDRAEQQEECANIVNGAAPAAMAKACTEIGVPLVHLSTDYVFDGSGDAPWTPKHPTSPPNAYGRSKVIGENAIRTSGATFAILRTSWIVSSRGENFVKKMLHLSESKRSLSIVADQIGGPTPARDIAAACLWIAKQLLEDPQKSGIYHFSGEPDVSWCDFAKVIFEYAGRGTRTYPISTSDYPTLAARPLNSQLDCELTEETFNIPRPDWHKGLKDILNELEMTS